MSAPVFRPAEGRDLDAVYALICDMEAKELPYAAFAEIFSAQLANPDNLCLVCEMDGETVGECNLRFEYQLHHAARIADCTKGLGPGRYPSRALRIPACHAARVYWSEVLVRSDGQPTRSTDGRTPQGFRRA